MTRSSQPFLRFYPSRPFHVLWKDNLLYTSVFVSFTYLGMALPKGRVYSTLQTNQPSRAVTDAIRSLHRRTEQKHPAHAGPSANLSEQQKKRRALIVLSNFQQRKRRKKRRNKNNKSIQCTIINKNPHLLRNINSQR